MACVNGKSISSRKDSKMKKRGVGVVVGRFQVHKLHEGHWSLIKKALEHDKTLICIGTRIAVSTPHDPLDYPTRERMIRQSVKPAIVVPLPDQPTDKGWSDQLDQLIHIMFPTDPVTMYQGRDSFQGRYVGAHKVVEIDEVPHVSGTDLRAEISRNVMDTEEFRCGVIYCATNQFTRIDYAVDICLYKGNTRSEIEVLLGQRNNEGELHRLPGGHIEHTDLTAEAAARRELLEETGLTGEDWSIVDQIRITSRDAPGYAMFTTLFLTQHTHGAPVPSPGELDRLSWVPLDRLDRLKYADNHQQLIEIASAALQEI